MKYLGKTLNDMIEEFKKAGFSSYKSDAETLFSYLLKMNRSDLYLNRDKILTKEETIQLNEMIRKRLNHFPIQYIINHQSFMGLDFEIKSDVLIPRFETEILVEKALDLLKDKKNRQALRIVDLGTGSGAIAISIAYYLDNVNIFATDISKKAIELAEKNAIKFKCKDRITFLQGNLFEVFKNIIASESIDGIITNPPYIPKNEISKLDMEVREHEPHLALDGGIDGLDYFRKIIEGSHEYLNKGGFLAMEIGMGQVKQIKRIFEKHNKNFWNIQIVYDYLGIERVVVGIKK